MWYYTSVFSLSILVLFIMSVLVKENGRLGENEKKRFYQTYAVIGLASISEWFSIILNGAPHWTIYLHSVIKATDYILTPMIGIFLISQVSSKNRHKKIMWGLIAVNAVFQIISIFTGWTFYIDSNNNYHHGDLHFLYTLVYIFEILMLLRDFWAYGKSFEKKNRSSLFLIVLFVIFAIVIQETSPSDIRTSSLGVTIGSVLIFIHYSEFGQVINDNTMRRQDNLLRTDSLTGLLSRFAYHEVLEKYSETELPKNLYVYSIDVNGLKGVNDTYGHNEGDKYIKAASKCIKSVFGDYGKIFRTGGDEFIVIADKYKSFPEILQKRLKVKANEYETDAKWNLSMSSGWASADGNKGCSLEKLVSIADKNMYADKAEYYRETNKKRHRYRDAI
ncbi:MAG: GGDEF domain-containing protein [Oscillospiraceae bacterium]|nr:GGDEF domain-containing protein [Oscillospiraceae bacterium]MDY3256713.1 GGDEF domain-containing protein [Ruminococcus callidus]